MTPQAFLSLLDHVRPVKGGWQARCPSHEDENPSLSVSERDGRILLCCHAGCETSDILAALGLEMADLFHDPKPNGNRARGRIVATYDYTDESGKTLFQVVRFEPKDFRQRRPDGKGRWIWHLECEGNPNCKCKVKLPPVRRVPYNLPAILKAKTVLTVEGEKDVETARRLGLTATCNPHGASKWRPEYSESFREKRVAVICDADAPGLAHGRDVARSLLNVAVSVKLIEALPQSKDLSDWIERGGTYDALLTIMYETPELTPADVAKWPPANVSGFTLTPLAESAAGSTATKEGHEHLTDSGNARRLVDAHGKDLKYCPPFGKWLVWDGTRWKPDTDGEIMRRAKAALKAIYQEAEQCSNDTERKALEQWAKQSERKGAIEAAIALAETEREVIVMPDELDRDPWLFSCTSGSVDLRTGELRAHQRDDLLTKRSGTSYNPNAKCPMFESFLDKIMNGNSELKVFLQTAIGYSLTGLTREQCVFILHGTGANGKSTLLEILRELFGDYAMNSDFTTFAVRDRTGASGDLARLAGARFVTAIETEPGEKLSLSRIKQVTGGDRVTARHLFQSEFEFTPQFKLFLAVNHKPHVRSTDHAIWRRIKLIPFRVTIPDAEQDKDLLEKLRAELPGILAWAVQGCLKWQKPGLQTPSDVEEATQEYREDTDRLHGFIEDCCERYDDAETPLSDLYESYCAYCDKNHEKAMSKNQFATSLTERGFEPVRFGKKRTRSRKGIRLIAPQNELPGGYG